MNINSSNIDCKIFVQQAYDSFVQNKTLTFHVNRTRSREKITKYEGKITISNQLREECLNNITPKTNTVATYFFVNLNGDTCYINREVMDQFRERAKKKFPNLKFGCELALVDKETGIEMMPIDNEDEEHIQIDNNAFAIEIKARAWIARLGSNHN